MKTLQELFKEGKIWLGSSEGDALCSEISEAISSSNLKAMRPLKLEKASEGLLHQELGWDGFRSGSIHEWFSITTNPYPSCSILSYLAAERLKNFFLNLSAFEQQEILQFKKRFPQYVLWIGRDSWPTPYVIEKTFRILLDRNQLFSFLPNCIFVDPPSEDLKQWAILAALSSPAISVVISELGSIPLSKSKQIVLSAQKAGSLGFFSRIPREQFAINAFHSKWGVRFRKSNLPDQHYGFELELLKCKGRQPKNTIWEVDFDYRGENERVHMHISPNVVDKHSRASVAKSA
ncbi:MAG: hypothetical protein KDD53_08620 [Bdellovibrionales bacterium]|nr:hypothetical protein [Bdellovibrionales bacterium]